MLRLKQCWPSAVILILCLSTFGLAQEPSLNTREALAEQAFRFALKGEFPQALNTIHVAQTTAEQTGDKAGIAISLIDSEVVYYLQGDFPKALEAYRKLPQLDKIKYDQAALAHVLSRRAFLDYYRKNYARALDDCQKSLELSDTVKDKAEIAFTLVTLGMIYRAQRDYQHALENDQKSLTLCEELGDRLLAAIPLYDIGLVFHLQRQEDVALKYYQQSLDLCQELGIKSLIHYVLFDIGSVLYCQGKHAQALERYRQSLALREDLGNKAEIALALAAIADVYEVQHDFENASKYYQQSLAIYEALGRPAECAGIINRIGRLYLDQNNYGRALEHFQKSLVKAEALGDKARMAENQSDIGVVHLYQANYDLALEYYQQSRDLFKTLGKRDDEGGTLIRIGYVYRSQGKNDLALEHFKRSVDLAGAAGNKSLASSGQLAVGEIYWSLEDYSQASAHAKESLALAEDAGDRWLTMCALDLMGRIRYSQGDYSQALEFFDCAASTITEFGAISLPWYSFVFAGRAYRALNQSGPARQAFEEAISIVEANRLQVAGGEQERERFFEDKVSPYQAMVDLLVAQNKIGEALAYAERAKARALLDALQTGRVNVTKAMTPEERERERGVNNQMVSLNAQISRENSRIKPDAARLADLKAGLQKARLEHEAFQTGLYAAHPELKLQRGGAPPLRLEDAAELLTGAKTALLEYVVTEDQTFLFVLTQGGKQNRPAPDVKVYPIRIKQKELAGRAEEFRSQLAEHDLDFRTAATQLYDLLIRPARAQLKGKTNLIIVPDQSLWQLPFQALQPSADRHLLEDTAISYSPSLTALREMLRLRHQPAGAAPGSSRLLAVGNPAIAKDVAERVRLARRDERLDPLPEAEVEVKALARLYGRNQSRVYIGAQATEDRLKAEAGNYDVLHLATHAVLDNASPMYSHIVLSQAPHNSDQDGLLEAWEMMNLDLKAKLVVLSACETARGKVGAGEGVIGMMWALFVAGCPTTVVSQWKVDSASTTKLMLEFHRNLTPTGRGGSAAISKAEALRRAATKLMKSGKYHHPLYWAGFIMVGDGL